MIGWSWVWGCGGEVPDPPDSSPPAGADGCDAATAPTSGTYTFEDQGTTRTWRLHVPPGYAPGVPTPLVLFFHGWGGDEDELLDDERVIAEADRRGYVVVAPRGLGEETPDQRYASWSFSGSTTGLGPAGEPVCDDTVTPDYTYPSCLEAPAVAQNTCSWTQCRVDDVAFVLALLAKLQEELCVDRTYAAGGSNGGMFTWELGQRAPGTFTAIAPLIGLPHAGYLEADPTLPVLAMTGTRDPVVPPGAWDDPSPTTSTSGRDRFHYTGATAITRAWAETWGCDVRGAAVPWDDGDERTDCRTWCAESTGTPPVLDCRIDRGHVYALDLTWPLMLDFFDAHPGAQSSE